MLDSKTTDKIRILAKNELPQMLEFIDESTLPERLGGKSEDEYDPSSSSAERINWGLNIDVLDGF